MIVHYLLPVYEKRRRRQQQQKLLQPIHKQRPCNNINYHFNYGMRTTTIIIIVVLLILQLPIIWMLIQIDTFLSFLTLSSTTTINYEHFINDSFIATPTTTIVYEEATPSSSKTALQTNHSLSLFYRYSNIRLQSNIYKSHVFLIQELCHVLPLLYQQNDAMNVMCNKYNIASRNRSTSQQQQQQLIIGRFGTSESHIMSFTEEYLLFNQHNNNNKNYATSNTKRNFNRSIIPSDIQSPGYYFTTERSYKERIRTMVHWGENRMMAYQNINVFAIYDWIKDQPDSYQLQMDGIQKYAPNAGHIHVNTLYPPCLTLPLLWEQQQQEIQEPIVPWTSLFENKVILIIHPFIDSIRYNIQNIRHVWSNIPSNKVYGAPYTCFPNVTEMKYIRTPLPTRKQQTETTTTWMESLEQIIQQINDIGYFDIALIGCGGYGLPLLAHIATIQQESLSTTPPVAIYMGGALQLLFGIHGSRWSTPKSTSKLLSSSSTSSSYYQMWNTLYNDAWIWPLSSDIVNTTIGNIENGAYVQPHQAIATTDIVLRRFGNG